MLNLRIRKNLDLFIVFLIIMQLVFLKFNGYEQIGNKLLTALIGVTVIKHIYKFMSNSVEILLLGLLVFLFLINILLLGGSPGNIRSNIAILLYPILSVLFIGYFIENYSKEFFGMMKKAFYLINGYYLLNVIVLMIQLQGNGFMVGRNAAGTINPMYEDLIAGLLGYSGTHQLSLFLVFVVLYNLTYWKYVVRKSRKNILFIYILLNVIFGCYISIENYNQAFFFLLPLAFILYILSIGIDASEMRIPDKTIMKYIVLAIGILFIIYILYNRNIWVQEFIDDNILDKLDMASSAMDMGLSANGSDERFAIILYGLNNYDGWCLGRGFGNYFIYSGGALGFRHFGQGSIGTLICLGGIWFVLAWVLLNAFILTKTIFRRINLVGFMIIVAYYIFLGVYCQVAYDNIVALWAIMSLLPIRFARDLKEKRIERY
ncbi:hypothetical protein H6A32_08485 [Drancourtella massiliensis]|uniref:O-antigen ligase domain-containing protein n=1 Tax=Drancourtella massiliensis TaxID=1632013 RepID=A0ABS2EH28_9FIRM|nr:hypothetical protein [Drancourtella massiliensis]MBM6744343.1 hypothetical protein [Drancourtella massiliensis]